MGSQSRIWGGVTTRVTGQIWGGLGHNLGRGLTCGGVLGWGLTCGVLFGVRGQHWGSWQNLGRGLTCGVVAGGAWTPLRGPGGGGTARLTRPRNSRWAWGTLMAETGGIWVTTGAVRGSGPAPPAPTCGRRPPQSAAGREGAAQERGRGPGGVERLGGSPPGPAPAAVQGGGRQRRDPAILILLFLSRERGAGRESHLEGGTAGFGVCGAFPGPSPVFWGVSSPVPLPPPAGCPPRAPPASGSPRAAAAPGPRAASWRRKYRPVSGNGHAPMRPHQHGTAVHPSLTSPTWRLRGGVALPNMASPCGCPLVLAGSSPALAAIAPTPPLTPNSLEFSPKITTAPPPCCKNRGFIKKGPK